MSVINALLVIAMMLSAGTWVSLRAASAGGPAPLPTDCLRRLRWWQQNARHIYAGCAAVTLCAALARLIT